METTVEKLVEECAKKTDKTNMHNYWNLVIWSFTNNFKGLQNISFAGVDDNKLEQFIKICDNRLDRSKTFLNHMVLLLGFDLTALSILVPMATEENRFYQDLPFRGYITFAILFIILIFLIVSLPHYRSDMHAWTAFKEKALMTQKKIENK